MKSAPVISEHCPPHVAGFTWENMCARCGSSLHYEHCTALFCDFEADPGDEDGDYGPCDECGGKGGWYVCLSSAAWCEANPLEGREHYPRGSLEWFAVEERDE